MFNYSNVSLLSYPYCQNEKERNKSMKNENIKKIKKSEITVVYFDS